MILGNSAIAAAVAGPTGAISTLTDEWRVRHNRSFARAVAASLVIHAIVLSLHLHQPKSATSTTRRIDATLTPRQQSLPAVDEPRSTTEAKSPTPRRPHSRVLAMEKSSAATPDNAVPVWSIAQKNEMEQFLGELEQDAKRKPGLEQRSLTSARDLGRQEARQEQTRGALDLVERISDGQPIDPFSLEMYLDSVVKKLNRSAAFVKNDPRSSGFKPAKVRVRFAPDGSLRSFQVLYEGEQKDQVSFVKSVVEQAAPYSAFPADILQSAKSLALDICILPASIGGGFGFSRVHDGHSC